MIAALTDAELSATYPGPFNGKPISTRQFLVHLNGLLNYHLGQIDYLRRLVRGTARFDLAGLSG